MKTETPTSHRPPVIAIMGHIDHGKSTLLAYIRKSTRPLNEAGGITQHVSAYEVEHTDSAGKVTTITFLDTPGHEAFSGIRRRGASVADIAVLVVSAEDGVKPQTIEALKSITETNTPYIVAINKIDKPGADIEKTKQSLAENEIYIEGYGGDIPAVNLSAKTGQGVDDLLDMILLVAELGDFTGNTQAHGTGVVIEANMDIQKGISATCIIKNGTINKGEFIASSEAIAPIRIMENYLGKQVVSATFSSPVKIIGWDKLPEVGKSFECFKTKEEALAYVALQKTLRKVSSEETSSQGRAVPVIIKADTGGSLEALVFEIKKLTTDTVRAVIVSSGIGTISENDIRVANGQEKALVIGFNVKVDGPAKSLADRNEIGIHTFDIIYKMSEWLKQILLEKTPKTNVEETLGTAKVLKVFSAVKDKQIIGGSVEKGSITTGSEVKILRKDVEIGRGRVRELQQQKTKTGEVLAGKEFGSMIESKTDIATGDRLESFIIVEK